MPKLHKYFKCSCWQNIFIINYVTNHVKKKTNLITQLILSIFLQPLHVSAISRHIIRRYNRMYTTLGTYYSFEMTFSNYQLNAQYAGGERTAVRSPPAYCTAVYRGWRYQRLWWYNWSSWGWAACCSKHVEERSVTYISLKNKRIVH